MGIFGTQTSHVSYEIDQWQWGMENEISSSSEKQEPIDFSAYSKDDILEKFKSSEWSNLEEHNRIALLQEMENRFAKADGREPATVKDLDTNYGAYNDTTNTMYIRVDDKIPPYEVLDSFVHEDNHAHQAYGSNKESEYDAFTQKMIDVESARDETGRMYNYEPDGPRYDMQCNEMDSNNKAATALLEESDRYKNDPKYHNYIQSRCEHFEEVNYNVENLKSDRLNMQQNQLYKAYTNGDLTYDEYETMKNTLYNDTYVDSTVEQSRNIESELKEMDKELSVENQENIDYVGFSNGNQSPCIFDSSEQASDSFDYTGGVYQDSTDSMTSESEDSMSY